MESLMKNIINNEQMISISDLKKQAKIDRKQNNNLSNHSESLKALAQQYNFSSWEKLLDASYLVINNKPKSFKKEQIHWHNHNMLEKLNKIASKMNTIHDEYSFLNNHAEYNALFNFFQINLLHVYNISTPIYQKMKLVIDFMINAFIEYRKDHKYIEFKDILSFAIFGSANPLYEKDFSKKLSDKLKKYMNLNNLHVGGLTYAAQLKIFNMHEIEEIAHHNEVLLILDSLHEKINIMATIHDVIEKKKKNNSSLTDWLSVYENFITLSLYDERTSDQIQEYQKLMREYFSTFFSNEEHTKTLSYLNHFINGGYETVTFKGTKQKIEDEIILSTSVSKEYDYNLDKALSSMVNKIEYDLKFYYIVH